MFRLLKTTVRFHAQEAGGVQYAPAADGPSGNVTLRVKGIIGFVALVAYVVAAGWVIAQQRGALLRVLQDLEHVHAREDALTKTSLLLAQAILAVNEANFETQVPPRFDSIAVNSDAVLAGLQSLARDFPTLSRFAARIDDHNAALRAQPERAGLLALRDGLHALVGELDAQTTAVREQRKKLSAGYRLDYDSMTVIAFTLVLVGFVLFGGITAMFFSRLAWDLKTLERRAREVVRGYRGEPLPVTRNDEVGGLMGAVNQMQSDLRNRERQLEMGRQQRFHQEKMAAVGSLAAAIAHEINNPIAAIAGVAQEMCATEQQRQCRAHGAHCVPDLILEQAQRIARITRQVSDLSAPQSAQMQWMDVNGLLQRTSNFVSYDQRLRGVEINLDLDSQLPACYGVPDEISQVIMNLLLNAADAVAGVTARRVRIDLISRADGETLVLMVRDNGQGMSEAALAHALEEGFTTKPHGSGMGLFICKSLIEARGGTIELKSSPGAGTEVRVRLPHQSESLPEPDKG